MIQSPSAGSRRIRPRPPRHAGARRADQRGRCDRSRCCARGRRAAGRGRRRDRRAPPARRPPRPCRAPAPPVGSPPSMPPSAPRRSGSTRGAWSRSSPTTKATRTTPRRVPPSSRTRRSGLDDAVVALRQAAGRRVLGAVQDRARVAEATVGVACARCAAAAAVDLPVTVVSRAEVIAGSTRMKAGTAQKFRPEHDLDDRDGSPGKDVRESSWSPSPR